MHGLIGFREIKHTLGPMQPPECSGILLLVQIIQLFPHPRFIPLLPLQQGQLAEQPFLQQLHPVGQPDGRIIAVELHPLLFRRNQLAAAEADAVELHPLPVQPQPIMLQRTQKSRRGFIRHSFHTGFISVRTGTGQSILDLVKRILQIPFRPQGVLQIFLKRRLLHIFLSQLGKNR
ncbi:hypothetical protein D3C76_1205000 [compost metagenome]